MKDSVVLVTSGTNYFKSATKMEIMTSKQGGGISGNAGEGKE